MEKTALDGLLCVDYKDHLSVVDTRCKAVGSPRVFIIKIVNFIQFHLFRQVLLGNLMFFRPCIIV